MDNEDQKLYERLNREVYGELYVPEWGAERRARPRGQVVLPVRMGATGQAGTGGTMAANGAVREVRCPDCRGDFEA
jgi:hypothetical protein